MIKSFSGQVVFCFAILRAISAYVGENWLSQYMKKVMYAIFFNSRGETVQLPIPVVKLLLGNCFDD